MIMSKEEQTKLEYATLLEEYRSVKGRPVRTRPFTSLTLLFAGSNLLRYRYLPADETCNGE
jgi:hypothetical protein